MLGRFFDKKHRKTAIDFFLKYVRRKFLKTVFIRVVKYFHYGTETTST